HGTISILAGGKLNKSQTRSNYKGYMGAFPWAQVATLRISDTVVILSGKKFAKALRYAVDELEADVVTMSMAGTPTMRMLDAINYAYEKGVLVVSAGGNSWHKGFETVLSEDLMYPARFHRVLGVTGATYDDTPYLISYNEDWKTRNEGDEDMQTCYGPEEAMKSVMAAYTPNVFWAGKKADEGLFGLTGGGTSSATPQVAAAAALWLHYNKSELDHLNGEDAWKKVEAVRKALFDTAYKVHEDVLGNGILRAKDALDIKPTQKYLNELKKTPADTLEKGWFSNLIGMFDPFNSNERKRKLSSMLHTEAQQVLMVDPDLRHFKNKSKLSAKLKLAIIKSPYASNTLKEVLSADKEVINLIAKKSTNRNLDLPIYCKRVKLTKKKRNDKHTLLISSSQPLEALSFKRKKKADEGIVGTLKIKKANNRNLDSNINLRLPSDEDYVYLVCETDERGRKHYSWNYPGLKKLKSDRNLISQKQADIIEFRYGEGRNIFKRIKQLAITIFRLVKEEALSDLKGLVYCEPMKELGWKAVDTDVRNRIKKQRKTLYLSHGILSSTENAFGDLISNKAFLTSFKSSGYDPIILGFNMPTVRTSISENIDSIRGSLSRLNLQNQELTVIGHSRGCLVARQLFGRYKNVRMILNAGPHLGTPLAHENFIPEFLDSITGMILSVAGMTSPVLKAIPGIIIDYVRRGIALEGLTDMAEGSSFLAKLNKAYPMESTKHTVIGLNFTASGINKFIDNVWDSTIFRDEDNDIAVPFNSAMSIGEGDPQRIYTYMDTDTHHISFFEDDAIVKDITELL
ncbi:MAG: S8 family serine peptidase, partial [Saprospiraceae bacterium]|nr:S8 family serine peptidase [Saprospiraceae bacterium]